MMTVKRRLTLVPTFSGAVDLMKTPVREMFVTYSWMKASNDSNSLLIVSRSFTRLSSSLIMARLVARLLAGEVELLQVVVLARHHADLPLVLVLGVGHRVLLRAGE